MVFEGIVISKIPYKERDLIVKLLLRNGLVAGFYAYGGQGGGKGQKPTLYELGVMMKLMVRDRRSSFGDGYLMVVSEASRSWQPSFIRHDVQAFYLSCLFFEIIQKFALVYHPESHENQDQEGIFSVLSNALFYLDESLNKKNFLPEQQLGLFMIKLLWHLGIIPDTDSCGYCAQDLLGSQGVSFLPAQGQFACLQCVTGENEKGFLLRIKKGCQTKYQEYTQLTEMSFQETDKLIHYFCHHFHLRPVELRSYSLLFK